MAKKLYLASAQGVVSAERSGREWVIAKRSLEEHAITSIAASGQLMLAGTREGIFRSQDGGTNWSESNQGLTIKHVRWLACWADEDGYQLAGTEPAGIFISRNGGESWEARLELEILRRKYGWYLPYSPAAGCVRGFALSSERIYAAVEVGGVLRSDDRGETWSLVSGSRGDPNYIPPAAFVHPDVHSITGHASSVDLAYVPTGGGFFRTLDGGATFQKHYRCYCRAVWVDPQDSEHIILGPADGVDRNGRIEESNDGGKTWQFSSEGLNAPWQRHMVERFVQVDNTLLAVLSNGELLQSSLAILSWERILLQVEGITALTVV